MDGEIVDDALRHGDDMRRARIDEAHHRLGGERAAEMGAGIDPFADQPRPASPRHRPGVGDIGAGEEAECRMGLEPSGKRAQPGQARSDEHTSELPSLMLSSYAVFCLQKKTKSTRLNSSQ